MKSMAALLVPHDEPLHEWTDGNMGGTMWLVAGATVTFFGWP